jgi:hypothetical protein
MFAMKKIIWSIVIVAVAVGSGAAAYFYWRQTHKPLVAQTSPPPQPLPDQVPAPAKPVIKQVVEAPSTPQPPLPPPDQSDHFMLNALADLIDSKSLMRLFDTEAVIQHLVATVDNLPRRIVPANAMPMEPPKGGFIVEGHEDDWTLSARNAARYAPYVKIAEAINPRKLVELYIRLYPLFQKTYEALGHPKQYFNDRLMLALDDLLMAPEIAERVKLVRPKVYYVFADPEFEKRSAGQKIMMRIGGANERKIKSRLKEIRQELVLHLQPRKVE